VRGLVIAVLVLASAPLHAQAIAANASARPMQLDLLAGLGIAHDRGVPTGWLVRVEDVVSQVVSGGPANGMAAGALFAWEGWREAKDWGFAMNAGPMLGVMAGPVRLRGMIGITGVLDRTSGDLGAGLGAFAGATLGFQVGHAWLGFDVRESRRWQVGAPDRTQWTATLVLGGTVPTAAPIQ
jgi:hypothetical protein